MLRTGGQDDRIVARPGRRTTLSAQDSLGGHTLKTHVGKAIEELADRARRLGGGYASSFPDVLTAEQCIERALLKNRRMIEDWLAGKSGQLRVEAALDTATGVTVDVHGTVTSVDGLRVILRRSPDSPSGFRVHTAFPQP